MAKRGRASDTEAGPARAPVSTARRTQSSVAQQKQNPASPVKVAETRQSQASVSEALSGSLLTVAKSLEEQGKPLQSLDPYLRLVEHFPGGREAPLAVQRLLAIAEDLRMAGQCHMAMTVLNRLEAVHQPE